MDATNFLHYSPKWYIIPAMDAIKTNDHYRRIRNTLAVILFLNWAVAIAKIIYGLSSRCASMTADGYHSLSDGASNIIGLIGIKFACQPEDADHPYGHKKYETLFSLVIAAALFIVAFNLLKEGINRFFNPITPNIDLRAFVVMAVTMFINLLVMRYEYKKGSILKSDILIADSMHTKADMLTSISVTIALLGIKLGFPVIDPIVTVIISLFITHAAYDIIRESSRVLCDTAAILDTKKITDVVLSVKGVKTCHKIRTRGRPDDIHIDLHVQVQPNMHIDEAHKVSYKIEEALKNSIPEVTDVVVHMEPKEKT